MCTTLKICSSRNTFWPISRGSWSVEEEAVGLALAASRAALAIATETGVIILVVQKNQRLSLALSLADAASSRYATCWYNGSEKSAKRRGRQIGERNARTVFTQTMKEGHATNRSWFTATQWMIRTTTIRISLICKWRRMCKLIPNFMEVEASPL